MKIFFMSDIHGSLYYTKKALESFKKENADYIAILGDELYHGARNPLPEEYNTKEVTKLLNEYSDRIIAIRGNCDSEIDELVLDFPMMSTYSVILYGDRRLFLTHGHIYNEDNLPKLRKGDAFHIWAYPCAKGGEKGWYIHNKSRFDYISKGKQPKLLWGFRRKYI
jgi:putative phosphoesterase